MTLVNISSKVRKEKIYIDAVALFDILLIAIMLTLLSSRFIVSPGFTIETKSELPTSQSNAGILTDDDLSVLNAKGNSMIIFDGSIFNLESFSKRMALNSKLKKNHKVLLIKADKNVDTQSLINICEAAKKGGFEKIQIATKPAAE